MWRGHSCPRLLTLIFCWDWLVSNPPDLFKYLIRDLSTGGVIRQERESDGLGNFYKKERAPSRESSNRVMESAFESTKPYVLTALGKQFVHYVMEDVVPQIGT